MDLNPGLSLAIFDLSGWHLLIILIICLLLFGRRLPEVMRGLGSSVKEFRKGMNDDSPTATTQPPAAPGAVPGAPVGTQPRDGGAGQPPKA